MSKWIATNNNNYNNNNTTSTSCSTIIRKRQRRRQQRRLILSSYYPILLHQQHYDSLFSPIRGSINNNIITYLSYMTILLSVLRLVATTTTSTTTFSTYVAASKFVVSRRSSGVAVGGGSSSSRNVIVFRSLYHHQVSKDIISNNHYYNKRINTIPKLVSFATIPTTIGRGRTTTTTNRCNKFVGSKQQRANSIMNNNTSSNSNQQEKPAWINTISSSGGGGGGGGGDDNEGTTATVSSSSSSSTWEECRDIAIQNCIVPLRDSSYKGSSGRVVVIGGSAKYTGAPYYAAMAALQTGCDLVSILTATEAAIPIKCYSPELMVVSVYSALQFDTAVQNDPTLSSTECIELVTTMVHQIQSNIERIHCLVIGPGMGRCPLVMKAVARVIHYVRSQNIPLILDADALYMLSLPQYRTLLQGYDRAIITPNSMEYKRLFDNSNNNVINDTDNDPAFLNNVIIVQKGKNDTIRWNGQILYTCLEQGGLKRSGGIGDILAGTISTLVAWNTILSLSSSTTTSNNNNKNNQQREVVVTSSGIDSSSNNNLLAFGVWTACCFVKRATYEAYLIKHRAMTAPDILHQLGSTIHSMTTNK